jgi:hypothetical protein
LGNIFKTKKEKRKENLKIKISSGSRKSESVEIKTFHDEFNV